jgi:hypothetical protein
MLAYALHEIQLKRGDEVVTQSPKEVFECASEKQFDELKALSAIREPTPAERALFGLAKGIRPEPAPAPAPKPETATERKKREAREKAQAEADAAAQAADDAAALEAAAAADAAALEAAGNGQTID